MKIAILYLTHIISNTIIENFKKLRLESGCDTFLVHTVDELSNFGIYYSEEETINMLGLKTITGGNKLFPGSMNFIMYRFYKEHPEYDYYWFIEYDVVFTGNWGWFIENTTKDFKNYDFVSSHIECWDESSGWYWWDKNNYLDIPREQQLKSFNPVCRYSKTALDTLISWNKDKVAHFEVLVPTCLYECGLSIADLGGDNEFTLPGLRNKYYLDNKTESNDGTIRWRPNYKKSECIALNKLYHPIKSI